MKREKKNEHGHVLTSVDSRTHRRATQTKNGEKKKNRLSIINTITNIKNSIHSVMKDIYN